MENWPSPNIEEELDQLSFADALGVPTDRYIAGSTGTSCSVREVPVYCSTDRISKTRLMQAVNPDKEGVRKISEKYDSVDKLRSSVARDRLGVQNPVVRDVVEVPNNVDPKDATRTANGDLARERLSATGTRMSDGASDVSDPNPSSASTASYTDSSAADSITEQDLLQAEMFFRSHKTEVHVCQCLANLYFASGCEKRTGKQNWEFSATGIPLLVLDTGEHHRKRRLQFVMAEKGTGFVLFKDVIDHLTKYSAPHSNFHTLQVSTDHTKQAGLSFDDTAAAADFHRYLSSLINNPDDDLLNLSKKKKKKDPNKAKAKKYKAPKKAEISQPCCFVHVTKLERPQLSQLSGDSSEGLDKKSVGSAETLDELSS